LKINRYKITNIFLFLVCAVIILRLFNLQLIHGSAYRLKSDARTTRQIELTAPRGEILDRYGRSIVKNRTGYNIYIQGRKGRESKELNTILKNLFFAVKSYPDMSSSILPVRVKMGEYVFDEEMTDLKGWKKKNGFEKSASPSEVMDYYVKKYDIDEAFGKINTVKIAAARIDMGIKGFSLHNPYLFCEDAAIEEVCVIEEQNKSFPDVGIVTQPVRDYPYGSLGAHILGHVSNISADEYEKRKEEGYTITSRIGKDGIERLMEDFLKGENGMGSIEQTAGGNALGLTVEKSPVSGRNISLTIDLDMQLAAEKALKETILEIRSQAGSAEGGSDADAGSIVVMDVNNGDVLAMASYPSYDIKNFGREYNNLIKSPSKPLFNRSLSGTYSPASTFKLLVAAAGLEEGVITPEETILDTGRYNYFEDYKPACWIFNQTGGTHGYVNVSQAIRDSCNIFFYETGRRLTIEKINEYARLFGLGKKTGIELESDEASGIVASPENRKKSGGIWYPGDTCQTAIGQSDTLVTPIQLASYMATIANGGTRYKPHIIKSVETADSQKSTQVKKEVINRVELKKENYEAIVQGIRSVVTEGTGLSAFSGCNTTVAAKTGSAQTSGNYTNGICVAYAPYDEPRIAIACVIEKAGSGSKTATAVRKIVDSYFDTPGDVSDSYNTLTN